MRPAGVAHEMWPTGAALWPIGIAREMWTVGVVLGDGESVALFAGDPSFSLDAGSLVLTNATDTALLLAQTSEDGPLIARIQVYGATQLGLDQSRSPRFASQAHS